ncbi:glycosyltransferase [Xenorhabdus sp. Reich]|uniref:Glycosyltransferase n=1 Tax=Xenorhabdus littoralis TaxID=2582835 RepID=A0ABU4SJU7_9GAMM|nr:glycosyltransferase [Xenorhabdus sp. Reich]MDX7998854.1 glycosyltransferase [Xenorhabdus sp. Reich]
MKERKKIMHVISGLGNGGAEGVLYRLCKYDSKNTHIIISLTSIGKYGTLLEDEGIKVYTLNMNKNIKSFYSFITLFKTIKKEDPDLVQTWMYHADLIGGIIAKLAGIKNIFWNIRHTDLHLTHSKKTTILIAKLCALLSNKIPKKIICCAYSSLNTHKELGYAHDKLTVIQNGYDLSTFKHTEQDKNKLKDELKLESDIFLIGMVARYDPQKNHELLLTSFERFTKYKDERTKLLLVGKNIDNKNNELYELIDELGIKDKVILLGQRNDIPNFMNMIDLHVLSSSFGEGFPNVIAEAMVAKTPCIATNIGDASLIIDKNGWIINSNDNVQQLEDALEKAYNEFSLNKDKWLIRCNNCSNSIKERFSIATMFNRYIQAWDINDK